MCDHMKFVTKFFCISLYVFSLASCGVSDYINSKKISNAPKYIEPEKTSECDFSQHRVQRVSKYLNNIRSIEQQCGSNTYPPAPIITWNDKLANAAKIHSDDMAENNFFNHQGSHSLLPKDRVSNANYHWKTVAENIAGGTDTPEQAIEQWLASPGHCHNIMNPIHTEFALACTRNNLSDYRIYWTLVLASPD